MTESNETKDQEQQVESAYAWGVTGRHTVSAGAGTGKTYNIQILFLRKILAGVEISQILVVTYTDMATAELRDRLRCVLMDCRRAVRLASDLAEGQLSPEDIMAVLQEKEPGMELEDELRREVTEYCESDCKRSQIAPFFVLEGSEGDGFIHLCEEGALEQAMKRLEAAVREFDQAQVSTIHGFCSRMLEVNAFESGIRYGTKVRKDMAPLFKRFRYEFWRGFCYGSSHPYLRMSCLRGCGYATPDALEKECVTLLKSMGSTIVWSERMKELTSGKQPYEKVLKRATELEEKLMQLTGTLEAALPDSTGWSPEERKEISGWLVKPWSSLVSRRYRQICKLYPEKDVSFRLGELMKVSKEPSLEANFLNGAKFRKLEKKEALIAENPWLGDCLNGAQTCYALAREYHDCVIWLCYDWIQRQVAEEKEREGLITFDDMLLSLQQALRDEDTSEALKQAIQGQFSCVMVDEAQDNDPVQSDIFNLVFGDAADAEDSQTMFYMIGDPKQAIYGFRGGDVDTFIASQERTELANRHTLSTNFRATKDYIEAMNRYFLLDGKDRDFFVHEKIKMEPIHSPKDGCDELVDVQGNPVDIGELLTWGRAPEGENPEETMAGEIQRLVSSGWQIRHQGKDTPVGYGDIAVLVRSNHTIEEVERILERQGIPVAKMKDSKVYDNEAAELILTLMEACLEISNLGKVRRLLGTPFFNFSAVQLEWVCRHCLNDFQEALQNLARVWENRTFGMMLQQFQDSTLAELLGLKLEDWPPELDGVAGTDSVQCRLLAATSGLTELSILQQLRDVLLSVSLEQRLGPLGLARYLADEMASIRQRQGNPFTGGTDSNFVELDEDDSDAVGEKRLTSERPAVRVMSIHKSKGLEFPLVYLLGGTPEKGFEGKQGAKVNVYHEDGERCMSVSEGKESASQDDRAEGRRLLYVGITRAKCWCRWLFKAEKKKKTTTVNKGGMVVDGMSEKQPSFMDCQPLPYIPEPEPVPELDQWDGQTIKLSPGWIQTSFSSLSRGVDEQATALPPELLRTEEEHVMVDSRSLDDKEDNGDDNEDRTLAVPTAGEEEWQLQDPIPFEEREDIFKFPGGTRTGTCWHKMFENLQFPLLKPDVPEDEQEELWEQVRKTLENFGQLTTDDQRSRFPAIQAMVRNVATRPIAMDGTVIRLCDLLPEHCLREFAFTYRFKGRLSGEEFAGILASHGIQVPRGWARGTGKGWVITGSIDMLFQHEEDGKFYILDWKTNSMGGNPENFRQEGMAFEMRKHFYALQYTLYTLAFIQYYRSIMPGWTLTEESYGKLIGGCIYVFVRGVDQQDRGIYVGCPPYGLLAALDAQLGVGSEETADEGEEA